MRISAEVLVWCCTALVVGYLSLVTGISLHEGKFERACDESGEILIDEVRYICERPQQ